MRRIALAILAAALLTLIVALVVGSRRISWSDLPVLVERLSALRSSPVAALAMLGVFLVGGLLVFPVNILIAASIVAFGPVVGAAIALLGSLASALLLHAIGSLLPERIHARFAGATVERMRERIVRHGVLAVAIVRLVPIAPYSIVSLAAGAAGVRRVPYLAGTALGMAPGIALYAVFVDRARAVIADPRPLSWAMLLFAIVLIVAIALLLKRLRRRGRDARS
ncbi:MAG TPA: VTT domain-containing protein [Rhodanobacteraceae bacterium]|nr:VTT domain-containing protein [Rhodanobacteraceae bacterium]